MPTPANVGPPEIHEPVMKGGASRFQMRLLGGEHHPRCHHYEWGPCTCARHIKPPSRGRRLWRWLWN